MDFLTCDKKTKPEPMPMPLPATSTTANERKALVDLHKSALFGESEPDMEDAMSVDTLEYEMESTICSSGLCELPTRNTSLTTVCSSFPLTARIESRHNWTLDTVESDSQQEQQQPRQPQEHSKGLSLPPNESAVACGTLSLLESHEAGEFDVEAQIEPAILNTNGASKASWC